MRVARAHHPGAFQPAVLDRGEARRVARGHAGGAREQRGGGGEVFAMAGARAREEIAERGFVLRHFLFAEGGVGEAAEVLLDAAQPLGGRKRREAQLGDDPLEHGPFLRRNRGIVRRRRRVERDGRRQLGHVVRPIDGQLRVHGAQRVAPQLVGVKGIQAPGARGQRQQRAAILETAR